MTRVTHILAFDGTDQPECRDESQGYFCTTDVCLVNCEACLQAIDDAGRHVPLTEQRGRGNTAKNPAGTKYSLAAWAKGYAAWLLVFPLYLGLWAFARIFKRVPAWLHRKLLREWHRVELERRPDVLIPSFGPTYMKRWWRLPRNAFFNVYFHHVLRSDEDAALHDHPWWNFSIVLQGGYYEHCIAEGGVSTKTWYPAGSVRFRRSGSFAHRLELERRKPTYADFSQPGVDTRSYIEELPVKTIFITGPVLRRWGFHHPSQWVDAYEWDSFTEANGIATMKTKGYAEQLKKDT